MPKFLTTAQHTPSPGFVPSVDSEAGFMLRAARSSLAIVRRSRYMTGRNRRLHPEAGYEMGHANRVG
jgi:hypothetical protein